MKKIASVALAASLLAGCTPTSYSFDPVASGVQRVRYDRGSATVIEDKGQGAMQITPLGTSQDGRLIFGMAAFNKAPASANFGLENVHPTYASQIPLRAFSKDILEKEAKDKAQGEMIAAVLLGAAAAYAANQNAYSQTNGYVAGPGGFATFSATTYNPAAAAIGTAAAAGATGYAISSIQGSMDATLDHLNGAILQTSTIDQGQSYGGEVVIEAPKVKTWPQTLAVDVDWNGDRYSFAFNVAKK